MAIEKEDNMLTEEKRLLELMVAKGIQNFKKQGTIPAIVFTSKISPEIHTILGLEVIQTNLIEPDKIIWSLKISSNQIIRGNLMLILIWRINDNL